MFGTKVSDSKTLLNRVLRGTDGFSLAMFGTKVSDSKTLLNRVLRGNDGFSLAMFRTKVSDSGLFLKVTPMYAIILSKVSIKV